MSSPAPRPARNDNTVLVIALVAIGAFVLLFVVIVVIFVAGGAAAFFLAARPVPVAPVVVAAPALSPARIITDPDGASVYRDGVLVCSTPCELALPDDAEHTVEIKLEGYQTKTMDVSAGSTSGVRLVAEPE